MPFVGPKSKVFVYIFVGIPPKYKGKLIKGVRLRPREKRLFKRLQDIGTLIVDCVDVMVIRTDGFNVVLVRAAVIVTHGFNIMHVAALIV